MIFRLKSEKENMFFVVLCQAGFVGFRAPLEIVSPRALHANMQ
jgi:hypothetical protein